MKIRFVSEDKCFHEIKSYWCDLFNSYGHSVFQSFEFNYYSWITELSKNKFNTLCIVLLERDNVLCSIFPLYIDSYGRLRFINDIHADFCDVLSSEKFDIQVVLLTIYRTTKYNSVHFINLKEGSCLYVLCKQQIKKNCIFKPFEKYSELNVFLNGFPEKILRYKSKQKTTFRRIKKRYDDNSYSLLLKDKSEFPVNEIYQLKNRMIDLGIRESNFLDRDRLLFLEELYNADRMLVSMVKNNNNVRAISFILKNNNTYLFWIDMYDNTKMINIYNYILFIENISSKENVVINFGRGIYDYKMVNFKPDVKQLFAIYIFRSQIQKLFFLMINKTKVIIKMIYKKIKA